MLSINDIVIINDYIYTTTSGGILIFDSNRSKFSKLDDKDNLIYLDLLDIEVDAQDRIWFTGSFPEGCLQIATINDGLIKSFINSSINTINNLLILDSYAFASYKGIGVNNVGLIEFRLDDRKLPIYKEYYSNFYEDSQPYEIRDIDVLGDTIYVVTDLGLLAANYIDTNIKMSQSWLEIYNGENVHHYLSENGGYLILESSILQLVDNNWVEYYSGFDEKVIQAKIQNDVIHILTKTCYYEIYNSNVIFSYQIPIEDNIISTFNAFDKENEKIYFALENFGIMILDRNSKEYQIHIPNTLFQNEFKSIHITSNGTLVGTNQEGSFVFNNETITNILPWTYASDWSAPYNFPIYGQDRFNIDFRAIDIPYEPGEHFPISIIENDKGNLLISNSGIKPTDHSPKRKGAVIEINPDSYEYSIYDTTNGILDGSILWDNAYMMVNQINRDFSGNSWVLMQYGAINGHVAAIQLKNDNGWAHIKLPSENYLKPYSISFDYRRRAWFGFGNESEPSNSYGGIKILKYNNISSISDSIWLSIANPEVLPGYTNSVPSIYWLAFDKLDFIWVLTNQGVQGYSFTGESEITLTPIYPEIFLKTVSFQPGNRIIVDSQNNKWIVTHEGVWVIQENTAFWPTIQGINSDNSGLLSDLVYDVEFDKNSGKVYFATDKGISIYESPFSEDPGKSEEISISPNPFIINQNAYLEIGEIYSGSIVKILTLNGKLIKEFKLTEYENIIRWNGIDRNNNETSTGIYLITAYHPTYGANSGKLAIIRK